MLSSGKDLTVEELKEIVQFKNKSERKKILLEIDRLLQLLCIELPSDNLAIEYKKIENYPINLRLESIQTLLERCEINSIIIKPAN